MNRLRLLALSILTFLFVSLLGINPVFAGDFDVELQSTYNVRANGSMSAVHNLNVVNNVDSASPTSLTIPVVGTEVTNVSARYQDGAGLNATASEDGKTILVEGIPDSSGAGTQWSLTVEYESDALGRFGQTTSLQIPPVNIPELQVTKQNAVINADFDLGVATVLGVESSEDSEALGQQVITVDNPEGPIENTVTLLFGQTSVINVDMSFTLKNDGWWFSRKSFTLPPDTNQQGSFIQSISPKPDKVHLDQDGNIVVEYLMFPKSSIDVSAKAVVQTSVIDYELSSSQKVGDTDENLVKRYTEATDNWQGGKVNPDVNDEMTAAEVVEAVNNAVAATVEDVDMTNFGPENREGALRYADMAVGELRAQGVPARLVVGKVISNGYEILSKPQNHAWAEAFVAGVGWVTVDPVFNARANYFETTDVFHLAVGLWGAEDDQPPVQLDGVSYQYVTEPFPESTENHTVKATKNVILPGLSVFSVSVDVPAGRIVDSLGAKSSSSGKSFYYGSLAPFQSAKGRTLLLGSSAMSGEQVSYGIIDENGEVIGELASAETSTSFLPMILLFAGIVLVALFIFWRKRRKRNKEEKPSAEDRVFNHEQKGDDIENDDLLGDLKITQKNSRDPIESAIPPATDTKPKTNSDTMNKQSDKPEAKPVRRKPPRLIQ